MASAKDLREVVSASRPLIEQWLDVAEQIAALRDMATDRGLDWSQIKALVKAQVQDERAGDNKRVQRIIEKAEFASAYADMLGLSEKVNENNFSGEPAPAATPHDPETGEVNEAALDRLTDELVEDILATSDEEIIAEMVEDGTDPEQNAAEMRQRLDAAVAATVEPFSPPAFLTGERKALRPNCQNPDNCAGYGRNHCHTCGKTVETEAA